MIRHNRKNREFEKRLSTMEKRIDIMECDHSHIEYATGYINIGYHGPLVFWEKRCTSCQKVLKVYENELSFLKSHRKYLDKKIKHFTS